MIYYIKRIFVIILLQKDIFGIVIVSIIVSFTIGWLWGLDKMGENWYRTIEIIASIGLVVVTGFMFYSISEQVKQGNSILNKEIEQLNISKDSFNMKAKLLTLDFLTSFEKRKEEESWKNTVSAIRKMKSDIVMNNSFRDNKKNTDDVIQVLDSYEWLSIRCLLLESYLDLDTVDEVYGVEMYDVLENRTVNDIKKEVEIKDFCSKLDIFYPKIKRIRENKMGFSQ